MSDSLMTGAIEAASRVRDAHSARGCRHAVRSFIRLLGAIPDERVGAISSGTIRVVQSLAENVIDYIEERLSDASSESDARELAASVYEIRRQLEEVNRWQRHYFMQKGLL